MISRKLVLASLMIVLTVIAAGCHLLGGGGWLPGLYGGKAHFGFNAECYEEDDMYLFHRGEFQYMDKSVGVRFHGDFEASLGVVGFEGSCAELSVLVGNELVDFGGSPYAAQLSGTCRTQPQGHVGTFEVYVEDNGTPGMAGDYIEVRTFGCGEDGGDYEHAAVLGGGNIWFEEHPELP